MLVYRRSSRHALRATLLYARRANFGSLVYCRGRCPHRPVQRSCLVDWQLSSSTYNFLYNRRYFCGSLKTAVFYYTASFLVFILSKTIDNIISTIPQKPIIFGISPYANIPAIVATIGSTDAIIAAFPAGICLSPNV